jgi:hypothetical protein
MPDVRLEIGLGVNITSRGLIKPGLELSRPPSYLQRVVRSVSHLRLPV